ncbi:hypothetical protein [uncultured Muribaculum sp.]|jgi:HTH-type transcriptional regulator/antitoxin HigA|nr:hypothetical protein [uncultured Muribaculum sp.]
MTLTLYGIPISIIMEISQQQYGSALARIEELLPLVSDDTPSDNPDVVELIKVSEIVREYELKHYLIGGFEQE